MQLKPLILLSGLAAASVMPAHAVILDRVFNKERLTVILGGSISPTLHHQSTNLTYYREGDWRAFDRRSTGTGIVNSGRITHYNNLVSELKGDSQWRMYRNIQNHIGSNALVLYARQGITSEISVFGDVSLFANSATAPNAMVFSGGFGVNHQNLGSLNLNLIDQLPTTTPATTSTYNQLDRRGNSVSALYTAIPNLELGAYYAFAGQQGTDEQTRQGYGATASYSHSFAPRHSLRVSAGVSHSERSPDFASSRTPKDRDAVMAGVRYRYDHTTLSVDGGVANSNYQGGVLDKGTSQSFGVRLNQEITPRLNVYGYYGERQTRNTEAEGQTLDLSTMRNIVVQTPDQRPINVTDLFTKISEKQYGVGTTYNLYQGIDLHARYERTDNKYTLADGDFSRRETDRYEAGVTLSWY